jgi:hypothetical protein
VVVEEEQILQRQDLMHLLTLTKAHQEDLVVEEEVLELLHQLLVV